MRINLFLLIVILPFAVFAQKKKILIVGTNIGIVNKNTNGTYLMEIAIPFNYFVQQGFEVDVVTPKGGKTAIYHKYDTVKILKEIAFNKMFIQKTMNSVTPEQIKAGDYGAIIFPGGYGHFYDVYENKSIAAITSHIYESGGVIGSLGHGTADLLNVKLKSGDYLVKNKTMTCFPTWCEKEFMTEANFGQLLPVDMEKELKTRGANLKVCTKENRGDGTNQQVVDVDNRLVTASFADGGEFVSKEIHKLLQNENKALNNK